MQKRIMVIDDDEMMLESLGLFLTDENYLIKTVDNSEMIDPALAKFNPELIIMDIRLDGADGRIICDGLKANSTTSHIPIILLTGMSYDEIALIDCEADAIMGKPYESTWLLSTIKQLLSAA